MKKILIFGISGLTGYKIARIAASKYDVYGTYNKRSTEIKNCNIIKIELTDKTAVERLFSQIKPDLVINTTALHNVDYCEENQKESSAINTETVNILRQNSEKVGSKLLHISTDYVFDGAKTLPYAETDIAEPISFYGKSKLAGERILEGTNHAVVRPSVVYGWTPLELAGTTSSSGKPMNFALWVLTKLNKNEPLKIVTDQFASATLADSLAESVLKIAESKKSGLYHVSGLSCESRYDFTVKLAEKFGYDTSLISKVTSKDFVQKAKRPTYSCLSCTKAVNDFNLDLLTTERALDIMKNQVRQEAPHLLGNNV